MLGGRNPQSDAHIRTRLANTVCRVLAPNGSGARGQKAIDDFPRLCLLLRALLENRVWLAVSGLKPLAAARFRLSLEETWYFAAALHVHGLLPITSLGLERLKSCMKMADVTIIRSSSIPVYLRCICHPG